MTQDFQDRPLFNDIEAIQRESYQEAIEAILELVSRKNRAIIISAIVERYHMDWLNP